LRIPLFERMVCNNTNLIWILAFLLQAIIYLTASVICVPIAKKLGLSSILGYLFWNNYWPFCSWTDRSRRPGYMHLQNLVVMMLFFIGLELEPSKFWKMRRFILGMGSMQLVGTTTVLMFVGCLIFMDWKWKCGLFRLHLHYPLLQLSYKHWKKRAVEHLCEGSSFRFYFFQDIAVIPILAFYHYYPRSILSLAMTHLNH
jgi:CPA2 family monovalent cation:H+ antiporter-2